MPNRPLPIRYEDYLKRFAGRWERRGLAALVVVLALYPLVASGHWLSVANLALVAIVGAVSLMILTGFTGQISLGHAAFLAIGAYTAALTANFWGAPFWIGMPAAGVLAALVGLAVGPFALRLRGLYLALVTLGLIYIVNHVLLSYPQWTGGVAGISVPLYVGFAGEGATAAQPWFQQTSEFGPLTLGFREKLYGFFLAIAALTVWCGANLQRSPTGRAMMAVRDHDLAAAVLGVHPASVKVLAFGLSSFIAGIAGAMYGYQQQYITVDPPFNLIMSVEYIAMIVIGGIGTIFGAVAGAITFVFLTPIAEHFGRLIPYLRELSSHLQATLLFALVVTAFMLFEPMGLYGIWLRIKRYFLAWPFRY